MYRVNFLVPVKCYKSFMVKVIDMYVVILKLDLAPLT